VREIGTIDQGNLETAPKETAGHAFIARSRARTAYAKKGQYREKAHM
jgi:hypothetical protein